MLEGKRNNILRPLELKGDKTTPKSFSNDHLDPSYGLAGIPPTLREDFLAETRKSQGFEILGYARI